MMPAMSEVEHAFSSGTGSTSRASPLQSQLFLCQHARERLGRGPRSTQFGKHWTTLPSMLSSGATPFRVSVKPAPSGSRLAGHRYRKDSLLDNDGRAKESRNLLRKRRKKKAESEIDSKDAGEADGETKFKDDVDDLSPEVKQVNSQSDSESSHSSHSSHSGGGRGSDSNHTQKHKRISGSAAGQSATKSAKASNELLALVETDYLDRNHRPRRPDHYIEIADWRGIRVEYGSDGSADDDSDGAGSSTGKRSVDLIRVGSYVRLAPGVDTFGCLNFGDRGIVTRMVSSRNASVPHRPRDAQAYEVLGPRNPGMFWFERGEIEKCPQKLFSPREWSRRKRCNTKKARIARAAKARKEWLLEERRRQYRRSRKGSRPKSLSNAPLNTDEAWRERGAEKLSKWRKQAEEEKAALVAVVKHSDKGPWVSHVHTERMIDMYEQTLRDRRKPLRQRAGIAVDPTQAGSRIDYTEASLRDGLHGLQSPSPVKSHRSRADEIVSHSPRRTQQLQVSKDRQRPSRRPKTAALLAGGYTSGILDQYNRERRFIASSKGLPSDAGYKGTVPALEQTRRSIGKPRNRRVHYAEDVLNDDDVMPPEQRLVVKTMAQGRIIDRRYGNI
eukprot:INCI3251.4.p1 GENE.INCI3251.4~~INCI3251.4.p1  ORF type:complete len:614 (+),score=67.29 INCI3251.4:227-2068(+)